MSQRAIIGLIGVLASGLVLLGRFGGLYDVWNGSAPFLNHFFPLWLEVFCVFLFAFGTAIVGLQITDLKWRAGLFLAILLQPISAMAVGRLAGCSISPWAWLVAILFAGLGVEFYRLTSTGKRQTRMRAIFGRHLSEKSIALLLQHPDEIHGKTSQATVLSARYVGRDWAKIEKLAHLLRERSAWVEIQTGNRLLAVWDMPLSLPTAAEKAVESTLSIGLGWLGGVATGEVIGELQTENNQWRMRGAVFEKADALCQANTTFGSTVLLDLATVDLVREVVLLRPVDFLILPGSELGVEVFEPLGLSCTASCDALLKRDFFWEAVIFFRQKRFAESIVAFRKSGDDAVVDYYLKRLERLTSS